MISDFGWGLGRTSTICYTGSGAEHEIEMQKYYNTIDRLIHGKSH